MFDDPEIQRIHRSAVRSIERVVEETAEPTPADEALRSIARQLTAGPVLALTGAGISTDSGVPDYRSPGGRLSNGRPMTYQEFAHSPEALHRYWARAFIGVKHMRSVAPNRSHYALVELERAGMVRGVVTQNVDGLHKRAGTRNLLPLHGGMEHVVCLDCGFQEERSLFDERLAAANPNYYVDTTGYQINPDGDIELPDSVVKDFQMITCANCGKARLKPDVVYFGESVPRDRREAVQHWLEESTSLLVVGSSLAVMSGYRIVLDALRQDKPVAVINGGPGRADQKVTTLWRTRIGPALDAILDEVGL
ncbi:Sir2 family NAD-dependent protein deacetylase [Corynebacterium breve]|uniref:protein acetyllysine N-acetyltransferase n=1 Tax=Corynebacterium breve TaxID=3049799 RepID=A0ABY8VJT3_9CORY|nr:Sir2 family NAD-dependent protein deacetylase [Corynebacterium breve]WIM67835.1 Sir2 family NAD-dependent protein deacetylase [Corynebacterium breve]